MGKGAADHVEVRGEGRNTGRGNVHAEYITNPPKRTLFLTCSSHLIIPVTKLSSTYSAILICLCALSIPVTGTKLLWISVYHRAVSTPEAPRGGLDLIQLYLI